MDHPIEVNASPTNAVLATLLRYALTALGGVLVAKGFLSQDIADQLVTQLLGLGLTLAPGIWGAIRARLNHDRLVTTANASPDSVAIVTDGK